VARLALPSQAQVLTGADAFRDTDVESTLAQRKLSLRIAARHAQRDAALCATIGVLQIYQYLGVMIFAACVHAGLACAFCLPAEQRFEEIALIQVVASTRIKPAPAELKPWRRLEVLSSLPLVAHLVVGGTLLRVFQDGVGLAQFLEAGFGIGGLADVRVILARQLAVGALDFILRCAARQVEGGVVILEFHDATDGYGFSPFAAS
jgi:hypothetical protein